MQRYAHPPGAVAIESRPAAHGHKRSTFERLIRACRLLVHEKGESLMAAGNSSTTKPTKHKPLETDNTSHLIHQPCKLSQGEAVSRNLFVFYSPKNQRMVEVCEWIHLALALILEFDDQIRGYVERPLEVKISPKQIVHVAFFTESMGGQRRYLMAIPKAGTVGHAKEGAALRDRARMDAAAARAGVSFTYVTEQDLLAKHVQLRRYFKLLPYVQSVRRVLARGVIANAVKAYFATKPRASIGQLILAIDRYPRDQVRSVVAQMIHGGTLTFIDNHVLSDDSLLELSTTKGRQTTCRESPLARAA